MSGNLHVQPDAGMIATLVRGKQVCSVHLIGSPSQALLKIVRRCDRYGWKIQALSTPATIYRDLDGSRADRGNQRGDMYNDHGEPPETTANNPEPQMLGKIGRKDLLA